MLDGGRANEQNPSDTAFASAADFRPVGRTDVQANARAASEPRVKTCSPTRPTTHWTSSSAPLSSPALPRSTPRPFLPVGTHRPLAVDALLHPGVHRRHPRSWADALLQNCAQSSDSRRPRRCCCRCSLRFRLRSCSRTSSRSQQSPDERSQSFLLPSEGPIGHEGSAGEKSSRRAGSELSAAARPPRGECPQ